MSEGFFDIGPNQTQQFSADDSVGLCVRMQGAAGAEITLSNFTIPEFFTFNLTRGFPLRKCPAIRKHPHFAIGKQFAKCGQCESEYPLPAGWANGRFFAVGPGTFNEFINP